ncbi:Nucleolar 27S pre-rRNA processing [Abeliophyllum distichum]|uniref:Nucleolar 27S pre-rRNA processing n=1 Tax=Abeliophyllum distichum TaxID=126358 RepID=A0ABD1U109_9LAMI
MLPNQMESSESILSHGTCPLEEFKLKLRMSFRSYVRRPSELHFLSAIQAVERAIVGVQEGCLTNYEIFLGSLDGGKVYSFVAAGIDWLELILEFVAGPKIFCGYVDSTKDYENPDSGSVILMAIKSGKTEGGYMVKPEASGAQVDASIVQFQILGPGSNVLNANASEQLESQVSSAAISPADLHRFVFAAIEEEMAGDSSYLVSIIVEFLRSASLEKLKVDPNIYVLIVQLIAREERYEELGLFVLNKVAFMRV